MSLLTALVLATPMGTGPAQQLLDLSEDSRELREAFNAAEASVRLILILSPT